MIYVQNATTQNKKKKFYGVFMNIYVCIFKFFIYTINVLVDAWESDEVVGYMNALR